MRIRLLRAAVLTVLGAVSGSSEVTRGFLYCPCSSTGRGYANGTGVILDDAMTEARRAASEGGSVNASFKATARTLGGAMAACARKYNLEACVNYDADRYGVFCTHIDRHALLLLPNGSMTRAPLCNETADLRSDPWALGLVPEPTPQPVVEETAESLAPAQPATATATVMPSPPAVVGTEPENATGNTSEQQKSTPIDEGCVAVQHLQGAVLLHRRHRLGSVLCAGGFCATPNHELIVRGVGRTCMRELCRQGWSCVRTTRFVNNLRGSVHRSWVVNDDITVTPFDVRYPEWVILLAQTSETWMNTVYQGVDLVRVWVASRVEWDYVRYTSEL